MDQNRMTILGFDRENVFIKIVSEYLGFIDRLLSVALTFAIVCEYGNE